LEEDLQPEKRMSLQDVIIIGAGPAGLAAAIAARDRHLDYVVLEKGTLVNSIYHFPTHMVFFTTPERLEIGGVPFVSPFEKPTRQEALRYYRRVAETGQLKVEMGVEVCAVRRDAERGTFTVESRQADGTRVGRAARAVIFAIGYFDHPNRLGIPGEDLPHVSHYYQDAHPWWRQRVVVVGGANSAAEAALELRRAGAQVTLVHRRAELSRHVKYWVLPDLQNRIKEGTIAARFEARPVEIRHDVVVVEHGGALEELAADGVFLLTGYRPDAGLLRASGVELDPCTWVPAYDAQTFETCVPNLFLAGGVVSGRDGEPVFIENGRFHGEKAVAVIAERLEERRT